MILRRFRVRLVTGCLVAAILGLPGAVWAQGVWDLMPYRVQLAVAFEDAPALTGTFREDFAVDLARRTKLIYGSVWDVHVVSAPTATARAALDQRQGIPFAEVSADWLKFDLKYLDLGRSGNETTESVLVDKLFVVRVAPRPGGFRVSARELDVPTQFWSSPRSSDVDQRALLVDEAARTISAAFAPLAVIEEQQEKQATLRVRAGGIVPRDPTIAPVTVGGLFRPLLRFTDREGATTRVQTIDWTMLPVTAIGAAAAATPTPTPTAAGTDETAAAEAAPAEAAPQPAADAQDPAGNSALVRCAVVSAMRNPLSARTRGRTQKLALWVVPPEGETVLRLTTRGDSPRPLSGYDVYSHPPGIETTLLAGRTDSRGELHIGPSPDHLLRVLLVKSGSEVLARLPVVPGLEPELSAALVDDDPRLAVEGFIIGLQEELIDTVARREVLFREVEKRLAKGELDAADAALAKIRALGGQQQYLSLLNEREKTAFSTDYSISKKLEKLFKDTREVIVKYLDEKRFEDLTAQLVTARGGA